MHTHHTLLKLLEALEEEAIEKGFMLGVEPTNDENTYLVANPKTKKVACIGLTEINNTTVIASYLMNMRRWGWYKQEGFTTSDMVETANIKDDIFRFISVDKIVDELSQ